MSSFTPLSYLLLLTLILVLTTHTAQAAAVPFRIPRSSSSSSGSGSGSGSSGEITLAQLDKILNGTTCPVPSSSSSSSSGSKSSSRMESSISSSISQLKSQQSNSPFLDECRTAAQALPFINKGFSDYNVTSVGEKAALLSLMVFESGSFQFNVNHFPGTPGQGTRNQMTFPFVYAYAMNTPYSSARALALTAKHSSNNNNNNNTSNSNSNSTSNPKSTHQLTASLPPTTQNAIRALVLADHLSFASAMWFYTQSPLTLDEDSESNSNTNSNTGCTQIPGMTRGLRSQSEAGWEAYVTQCVGTSVSEDRKAVWAWTLRVLNGT